MNRILMGLLIGITLVSGQLVAQSSHHVHSGTKRWRGRLVSTELLRRASRNEVAEGLSFIGWADGVGKSGIAIRRLVYTTVDAHGSETLASGLLALPTDVPI